MSLPPITILNTGYPLLPNAVSEEKFEQPSDLAPSLKSSSDFSEQTLTDGSGSDQSCHSPHLPKRNFVLSNLDQEIKKSPKVPQRNRATSLQSHSVKKDSEQMDKSSAVFSIHVPLQLFINAIDIPVISFKEWKGKVIKEFYNGILNSGLSVDCFKLIMSETHGNSLEHSSILQRIEKARNLLNGINEYKFLGGFLERSNLFQFYEKYIQLREKSHSKAELLYNIIGKEQALKIIKCADDPDFQQMTGKFKSQFHSPHSPKRNFVSSNLDREIKKPPTASQRGRATSLQSHSVKKDGDQMDKSSAVFSIRVPLQLFINAIDISVISCKEWKGKVMKEFCNGILNSDLSVDCFKSVMLETHGNSLEHSSILQRIEKARNLLNGINEYKFLGGFLERSNLFQFYEKYIQLREKSHSKAELLYNIIGQDQALKIIKCADGPDLQKMTGKFESQFYSISCSEKKRRSLMKSSFIFQEGFDVENLVVVPIPIYLLSYADFEGSFRSFYSDGPFLDNSIRINDKNQIIPNYKEMGIKDEDREVYFLKWLISKMQDEMQVNAQLGVDNQIEAFSKEPISKLKADALSKYVSKCFSGDLSVELDEKEVLSKITPLFSSLQKEKSFKEFSDQMSHYSDYISNYLTHHKSFKEKNWMDVSFDLLKLYQRVYQLEMKYKSIPTLALLKSMCFSSYASGEMFLRKTLCPDLFTTSNQYHLTLDRDFITSFDICGYKKSFDVKHIKSFKVVSGDKVKASISIHWTIKGSLGSRKYAAALELPRFDFDPDCAIEECQLIMKLFHLDYESSPWGDFVKRVELQDAFGDSYIPKPRTYTPKFRGQFF